MIQRIPYGILVCLILLAFQGRGQIKDAKREMELYNYTKAISILKEAMQNQGFQGDTVVLRLLAECYRFQNDILNTKLYYGKLVAEGQGHPSTVLHFARALRSSGEYPEAKRYFLLYDSLTGGPRLGKVLAGYCDSASRWKSATPIFEVTKINGLNTSQSEFGMAKWNDRFLFSSDRVDPKADASLYGWTGNPYLRQYSTRCITDSAPTEFQPPTPELGLSNPDGHDGPVSYCETTKQLFINRTIQKRDKGKKEEKRIRTHLLKIFTSENKGGEWTNPVPFFLNNDHFSVGHPCITPDGKRLFFVSDMPGGYGETDIYYCTLKDGIWGEPINLGKEINTSGKEMFPSLHNDRLYFASDGHPGFGGLDINVSTQLGGKWSSAENLGYPLNSSYDDFSICFSDNETSGYFSSNRPGGKGGDDMYRFSIQPIVPEPVISLSGLVKERSTLLPIPGAMVYMLDKADGSVKILKTDSNGFFRVVVAPDKSYQLKATMSSYFPDCCLQKIQGLPLSAEQFLHRDLLLDRIVLNQTYLLDNILYNFDKWNIREDAKAPLDDLVKIMKENPLSVELGSHTDCRGSAEYNEVLSQKRAEAAVQYILSKGIDPSRITAKGYGESQPLNHCNCENGISCSPEEYQRNRRTEFKIITIKKVTTYPEISSEMVKEGEVINIQSLPEGFFGNCE